MYPTDEELVAAYLDRGDQHAFRMLVERHQERVFSYLFGMVRDRETANDLFQETFFRVIAAMQKERGSYTTQGRWIAWVLRIARNAALDHFRRRKKWRDVTSSDEEVGASFWDNLPDEEPGVDEVLHQKNQSDWLAELIGQLPPEQREVLLLRQESELTFREIAELTGCSINTALGRMRYALLNLKRSMAASGNRSWVESSNLPLNGVE